VKRKKWRSGGPTQKSSGRVPKGSLECKWPGEIIQRVLVKRFVLYQKDYLRVFNHLKRSIYPSRNERDHPGKGGGEPTEVLRSPMGENSLGLTDTGDEAKGGGEKSSPQGVRQR